MGMQGWLARHGSDPEYGWEHTCAHDELPDLGRVAQKRQDLDRWEPGTYQLLIFVGTARSGHNSFENFILRQTGANPATVADLTRDELRNVRFHLHGKGLGKKGSGAQGQPGKGKGQKGNGKGGRGKGQGQGKGEAG